MHFLFCSTRSFSTICFLFYFLFFFHAIFFSRHEINPNNFNVNASMHQSKQNFHNFLFKLPLSSSNRNWNITNHFSNQCSAHAAHSINYAFVDNSNVSTSTRYQSFAINVDNELRSRHIDNPNQLIHSTNQSYDFCARATCQHRRPLLIDHVCKSIAHFMEDYHVISCVIIGITFYIVIFYFIYRLM